MRCLIQRVSEAAVAVEGQCIGAIGQGLLVLVGVEPNDGENEIARMVSKLLAYRVFNDQNGRMNLDVRSVQGGLLLVSQFTLAADTRKGLRPGFSTAAAPELAARIFDQLVTRIREQYAPVATGQFGADMQVTLTNDGPVTFLLESGH